MKGPRNEALANIAAEAMRHVEWLRESGVREVERAPAGATARRASAEPTRSLPPARDSGSGAPAVQVREAAPSAPDARATPSAYALVDKGCGSDALLAIREDVGECRRCKLAGGRKTLVFGVGNPRAELMFVGEGPGADEDEQGEPFVGKAGQLLTKMIEAMGFARSDVYIANVVKCRPPGNRDPEPDEIAACEPFLKAQIAAVRPKVVVALGRFAVQTLLRDATPITKQRGIWRTYEGVKLMPTFHPAYLLRNPPEKRKAWDDLQLVMKELGKTPPAR
ncbi:MAG TPA: uracil-DNA glycosylase [Anaeromyxobacteraceae bacterium]|nr:uracil-DNA glycosylase [Anaeromyxobacteraceae bacterium]